MLLRLTVTIFVIQRRFLNYLTYVGYFVLKIIVNDKLLKIWTAKETQLRRLDSKVPGISIKYMQFTVLLNNSGYNISISHMVTELQRLNVLNL